MRAQLGTVQTPAVIVALDLDETRALLGAINGLRRPPKALRNLRAALVTLEAETAARQTENVPLPQQAQQ